MSLTLDAVTARQYFQMHWVEKYAPGLELQPFPDNGTVDALPLTPYGLQYRLSLPDGSTYPRHQSGPGATIVGVLDRKILIKDEFREESGLPILKCAGGFAGHNRVLAEEMVGVYNALAVPRTRTVTVTSAKYPEMCKFVRKVYHREFGVEIPAETEMELIFFSRPIGWPNIRICSVCGMLTILHEWLPNQLPDGTRWINFNIAEEFCERRRFGDENTDRGVRGVLQRLGGLLGTS